MSLFLTCFLLSKNPIDDFSDLVNDRTLIVSEHFMINFVIDLR